MNIQGLNQPDLEVFESQVLLYYLYNSNLSDKKKAYLYARVVKNKEKNPSIYQSYAKIIEQFVRKQLKEHHISRNLSILYDDLLINSDLDDDLYHDLTEVLFQNEIHCANKSIKGVYVIHKELTEESFYPFVDGKAMISLYTEDSYVLLADMNDNRYTVTIDYTIYPYMYGKQYLERCYEKNNNNPKLILAMLDNASAYQNSKNKLIELKNKALYIATLKQRYQEEFLKTILYEYSDFIDEERIYDYLERIDLSYFNSEERNIVIEFLIGRKQYEKAYDIMKEYGYENLNKKVLVSLCIYFLKKNEEKNDSLILLSYEIFLSNLQKEEIMRYLVRYYNGTSDNLLKVYKKAKEYNIDCIELEERLLAQMLFSNRFMDDSYEIFYHIYNSHNNEKLKKAYLVSMAYQWILYDNQLQDELLKIMTQVIQREENEIILIAVLKSLSTKNQLSNDEILFIEVNLEKLMKKGITLSFYRDFIGKVKLDDKLTHTYFIEYKTNPNKKVFLHYSLSSSLQEEEKNQVITMHNVFGGIYSAQFVLFYGESIEYYIIEEEKEKNSNQAIQITLDNKLEYEDDVESKYNQINLMLMAKELNDEETLIEMMKKVKLKEGMASYLFKPLL
jgi:hypothetical protein